MKAGYNGRIAVFWSQTEIDGLEAAPLACLSVGVAWSWHGRVKRLPEFEARYSEQAEFAEAITALAGRETGTADVSPVAVLAKVVLTNGAQQFEAELTQIEGEKDPVLLFENGCPARGQEFWISMVTDESESSEIQTGRGNVVTFPANRAPTPRTLVLSPQMAASAAE